ncbi:MAG: hypothetical protein Q4B50_05565 [Bacillota bacterium]|nr:hypothetical protein [Bacillota bacterium]
MKKILCCLLAFITLCLSGCLAKPEKLSVEEVPIPYTIRTKLDGNMEITVDTSAMPGFDWQQESFFGTYCEVDFEQGPEETVFHLKGIAEGIEEITLFYLKDGDIPDYRIKIFLRVEVNNDLHTRIIDTVYQEFAGNGSGGEDTILPYAWETDSEGQVKLSIFPQDDEHWYLESEENGVCSVSRMTALEDSCYFTVDALASGSHSVRLEERAFGSEVQMHFTVTETGMLQIETEVIKEKAGAIEKPGEETSGKDSGAEEPAEGKNDTSEDSGSGDAASTGDDTEAANG